MKRLDTRMTRRAHTVMDDTHEFRAPQSMTPDELGDSLARLVWESFSDFLAHEDVETPLPESPPFRTRTATPTGQAAEEALIFFMWAHTRGAQLAFLGADPRPAASAGAWTPCTGPSSRTWSSTARPGPAPDLRAAGQRALRRVPSGGRRVRRAPGRGGVPPPGRRPPPTGARWPSAITERAIAVANPLKDFLEEVELVD